MFVCFVAVVDKISTTLIVFATETFIAEQNKTKKQTHRGSNGSVAEASDSRLREPGFESCAAV